MHTSRPLLLLTSLGLALAVTACGSGDPAEPPSAGTSPTERTAPTETLPDVLPITAHVLGSLPGFRPQGRARAEDARAFAGAHEKDVAELREAGFVTGSTLFFGGKGQDFALSIAAAYDDAAAASTEADRLFASNTEGDPSLTVLPLDVPGVPDARAVTLQGAQDGTDYTGVEIVFVDGGVLHEVFAVGQAARFDVDAVVAAVAELHDEVAGHPLPAQ